MRFGLIQTRGENNLLIPTVDVIIPPGSNIELTSLPTLETDGLTSIDVVPRSVYYFCILSRIFFLKILMS